ncbi:MAG: hypothetical protein HOQ32_00210 [Lysobacter sp.]|nr:hypothetical protein [Lysobacter sp.]
MLKRTLALAAIAAAISSPAYAGERWLVYTGGEKPNRLFVVVDETYLDAVPFVEKTYKLETITLLENAKAPDWVSSNMIIDCGRNTLEEKLIQVSPRGGKLTTAPDQPAMPPKNAVGESLIAFACDMGPKDTAKRLAARKSDQRERGWMYLGPLTTGDVGDLVWNSVWTDGKRPAGTPRSAAELEREMADLGARRQKALAEANALAGQTVQNEKIEAERYAKAQEPLLRLDKRRKREAAAVRRGLEAWIGQPEAELLRVWGTPTQSEDHSDRRIVAYTKQVVDTIYAPTQGCPAGQTMQPVNGMDKPLMCAPMSGPVSWERVSVCTVRFEFRDGAIVDYVTQGAKTQYELSPCSRVFGKTD